MENFDEYDKQLNRAKSNGFTSPMKIRNEPGKRKSFIVNDAVRSVDYALSRLKKSKVSGECESSTSTAVNGGREPLDMFMDVCPSVNFNPNLANSSLLSMNFSHYELARNLSNSNCTSDAAISCATSSTRHHPSSDSSIKNEQLERFFRSAEMWTRKYNNGATLKLHLPDK